MRQSDRNPEEVGLFDKFGRPVLSTESMEKLDAMENQRIHAMAVQMYAVQCRENPSDLNPDMAASFYRAHMSLFSGRSLNFASPAVIDRFLADVRVALAGERIDTTNSSPMQSPQRSKFPPAARRPVRRRRR